MDRAGIVASEEFHLFGGSEEQPSMLFHGTEPKRRERCVGAVLVTNSWSLGEAERLGSILRELVVAVTVGKLRRLEEPRLHEPGKDVAHGIGTLEEEPLKDGPDREPVARDVAEDLFVAR